MRAGKKRSTAARVERNYPAVGLLRFPSKNFGSGALITPTVVLTAAHVALGKPDTFFFGTVAKGKSPNAATLRSVPGEGVEDAPLLRHAAARRLPGSARRRRGPPRRAHHGCHAHGPLRRRSALALGALQPLRRRRVRGRWLWRAPRARRQTRRLDRRRAPLRAQRGSSRWRTTRSWCAGSPASPPAATRAVRCSAATRSAGTVRGSADPSNKGVERTREGYTRIDRVSDFVDAQARAWR